VITDNEESKGVGVMILMKDKELKVEEIEDSHSLGEGGEGRVQGRGKWSGCTGVDTSILLWC
jgi:hypothetical protein